MTIFLRQIWAELLKARKRGLYGACLAALLFFAIIPFVAALVGHFNPAIATWSKTLVAYPAGLWLILQNADTWVLPIAWALLVAGMVGEEYSLDTWKMILPRARSRSGVLWAKLSAALLLTLGALLFAVAIDLVAMAAGAAVLHAPLWVGTLPASEAASCLAYLLAEFAFSAALALTAVVLSRSQIAGMAVGFVAPRLLSLLTYLPHGNLGPYLAFRRLEASLTPWASLLDLQRGWGGRAIPSLSGAVASVAIGIGLLLVCSFWTFERRDQASKV